MFASGLNPTLSLLEHFRAASLLREGEFVLIRFQPAVLAMHYPNDSERGERANGFTRIAPAMIGQLTVPGVSLASEPASADVPRRPFELADLEVLVDGVASPLYRVSSRPSG